MILKEQDKIFKKIFSEISPYKKTADEIIQDFQSLIIVDAKTGDDFFVNNGIGNIPGKLPDNPYFRHVVWEYLLKELKKVDPNKFNKIHKGVAFYFLAWTAFDMNNFEKAIFYMDATISEDIRKTTSGNWKENPMYKDWTLQDGGGSAVRVQIHIKEIAEQSLRIFRKRFGLRFNNKPFMRKVIDEFIESNESRPLITTFFTYILSYYHIENLIRIRSVYGGSIEPFIFYLFRGCLLFESLLKHFYKIKKANLGGYLHDKKIRRKYSLIKYPKNIDSFNEIFSEKYNNEKEKCFLTIHKIRNFVGHSLLRKDNLTINKFKNLHKDVLCGILLLFYYEVYK